MVIPTHRALVSPSSNPPLEKTLRERLQQLGRQAGRLGELEPLALRLGLMQACPAPVLASPQLLLCVADHGLAVDGLQPVDSRPTAETVGLLLQGRLPLNVFAARHGIAVQLVDCGMADELPGRDGFLVRKIAHGTRNARAAAAMSLSQVHAAIRAGMETADKLPGNVTMLAGLGMGAHESAALVLSRLADCPVRELLMSEPEMDSEQLANALVILQGAQGRHREVHEPVEVLAAFGGFEQAVMVGVMLMAASKRHLLMVDGMAACAALMVAARIAPSVTDYCVFCRSHGHYGLDQALNLFRASAMLELGMDSVDGTGATLAWPLVDCAAGLLAHADGQAGPPAAALPAPLAQSLLAADTEPDTLRQGLPDTVRQDLAAD